MSHYEFIEDRKLFNTIKSYPVVDFYIFNSKVYYQNSNEISGKNVDNVFNVPVGHIDLYNLNVDRVSASTGRVIGPLNVPDTGLIYPFITKDSKNLSLKGISSATYIKYLNQPGSLITGSYNLSSSIYRQFISSSEYNNIISSNNLFIDNYYSNNPSAVREQILESVKPYLSSSLIGSLENTLANYSILSPRFLMSSSYGDKRFQDINVIKIPSVFFGSEIKPGSLKLNFYITGTLVSQLVDVKQNGELLQVSGTYSSGSNNKVAGVALYKHGIILLTGSWDLSSQSYDYGITGGSNSSPKWVYWGSGCNDNSTGSNASDISWTSSSYSIEFKGTNYINTKTFFCDAPKGELNWSNNPTFLSQSSLVTGSYVKETDRTILLESKVIHNLASSSNSTFSSSYSNVTYINYVNLFDQDGNLIAIAKTSKPIKKTEDIDFTFKLKLDI